MDIICGILLAFVRTCEVGVSSRNVVSRTFPHFSQSMLTPMVINFIYCSINVEKKVLKHVFLYSLILNICCSI